MPSPCPILTFFSAMHSAQCTVHFSMMDVFEVIRFVFSDIREKERTVLGHSSVLQSLNVSMTNAVSTMATVVTFIVHIYTGHDLLASQVGKILQFRDCTQAQRVKTFCSIQCTMPSSAGIQLRMHGQSKGLETQAKTTRYSCEKKYNSGF